MRLGKNDAALLLRGVGPSMPIQGWATWILGLTGWRRYLYAVLVGAIAAGSLPPVDLTPLLLVSFPSLIWLADAVPRRRDAFFLGWCFGFGFFVAGLYWIGAALLVDIDAFWWLMPFAVLGIPAGLAIFIGVALFVADALKRWLRLRGTARILTVAACWCIAEWLRGHVLTGFPWNLIGYAWSGAFPGSTPMLQITSIVGIYGLSLITVTAASLPARLGDFDRNRGWAALAAVLLIVVPMAGGAVRVRFSPVDLLPGITIRLVQPSIPEALKNDPAASVTNLRRLLDLSGEPTQTPLAAVVWPEAAAPPFLEQDDELRRTLALAIPSGALLMTGDVRTDLAPAKPTHIWNSLLIIGPGGDVVATYDKAHLVPFGEYVPLRNVLPLRKITPGTMDFSAGPGPQTLSLPDLPSVAPFVCYEAIFPGAIVDPAKRPGWLLNVTNDAWYGVTSGPFQHFAIARVRAVEEGLPLLRDANNGITGAFDPYGRVLNRLDLDAIGVIDVPLPAALQPTVYSLIGDASFVVLLIVESIIILVLGYRSFRR